MTKPLRTWVAGCGLGAGRGRGFEALLPVSQSFPTITIIIGIPHVLLIEKEEGRGGECVRTSYGQVVFCCENDTAAIWAKGKDEDDDVDENNSL